MKNNVVFTIEQVDNKLMITIDPVSPAPTMVRTNDGNTETIEFVDPPLTINTERKDGKPICGIDLSKYKAFPKQYTIPINTEVICIKENDWVKIGSIGVTKEMSDEPFIRWNGNNYYIESEGADDWALLSHKLAPLDPTDHPDYRPEEVEQDKPMDAEQIVEWATRTCYDNSELIDHINALVQYEVNKAKR